MNPDYGAVDAISRALVDQAVTAVRDEFEDEVKRKAGGLSEDLAGLAGEVGSAARDKIRNALQLCVDGSADQVRQRVDEIMEKIDNIPPRKLEDLKNLIQEKLDGITDAQRNAFADAVKARLDDRGDEITGNAAAIKQEIRLAAEESIRELKVNASGKVRNALTKAERQLAAAIEAGMDKAAAADVEEEWDWVDPYVGVRGRINLPKRMFVGGRADVGGFGVGSDLMVQLFGGVGVRLTRNVDLEAGWRYLSVDYDKDGFLWDTEYSGVGIGVAIAL
jgi:gas vesicle protein